MFESDLLADLFTVIVWSIMFAVSAHVLMRRAQQNEMIEQRRYEREQRNRDR